MYRGVQLQNLLDLKVGKVRQLLCARQKRRLARQGIKGKYQRFLRKLRTSKAQSPNGEKPRAVKTHLRNCIILPEMVGSVVECYSGNEWHPVEIKTQMIGQYLGQFSLSYKLVRHGRAGIGATHNTKYTPPK